LSEGNVEYMKIQKKYGGIVVQELINNGYEYEMPDEE
jgi:hypothetical protein